MAEIAYFERYNEHETRRTLEQVSDEHILPIPSLVGERLASHGACRVLDIGCGNSNMGIELADMYPEAQIFTLDVFADNERSYSRDNDPDNLHFAVSDGNALPFPAGQFDIVLSTWAASCYYTPGFAQLPTTYISEIARVLKPDGIASIRPESIFLTGYHGSSLHKIVEGTFLNPSLKDVDNIKRKAQDYLAVMDLGFRISFRDEPHRVRLYGPQNHQCI